MAFSKLHTSVAVIGIAAAAGLAWWWQHKGPAAGGLAPAAAVETSGRVDSGPSAAAPGRPGAAGTGGAPGAAGRAAGGGAGGAPGGPGQGPAPVEVAKVETQALADTETAVGSIASNRGVMLRPEISGRIAALNFKDGQTVRRGQVLVQLDDTLLQAQLKQALAQAAIARTNLARNRELLTANFVSQSAVDQTAAALEVAESQVALARAQLARTRVVAPFDGVIGIRVAEVGDYVKDGADIVGLEDVRSVWVDFRLPERVISRLRMGQVVEVSLDALPGRQYKGRVEAADAQVDANGRSLLVRARLDNDKRELRAGMFARVRAVFDVRQNALVVPEEALVPQGNRQFLFKVIEGPGGTPVAERVEARLGLRVPGKVEVLAGVQAGDTIVTAGQNRLLRGESPPVRIVELGRGAGAPGVAASGAAGSAGAGAGRAPNAASAPGGEGAASAPRPAVPAAASAPRVAGLRAN